MDYYMSCHCICHETAFMLNKLESPYGCPTCHDFHDALAQDIPLTPDNVRAIIAETTTHTNMPYDAVVYYFRIKTTPHAMNDLMVKVAVASSLAQTSWLGGEELAHQHLCSHLKKEWKDGQPPWVRLALAEYNAKKPQVGGQAMVYFHNQWSQMQGHPSFYGQNVGGDVVTSDLQTWLPGLNEAVQCPALQRHRPSSCSCAEGALCLCPPVEGERCENQDTVQRMIVHLNDGHRWKRAQIADWLESLDVDLTFGAEPPPKPELPPADRGRRLVIIARTIAQAQNEARRRHRHPADVVLVSTQGPDAWRQIRGMHGIQYCVAPGTVFGGELKEILAFQKGIQVGEEVGINPGPNYSQSSPQVKEYISEIQQAAEKMLQQYIVEAPKVGGKSLLTQSLFDELADFKAKANHAHKTDSVKFLYQQSSNVDPWPGEHIVHLGTKDNMPAEVMCAGPECGICKLIKANYQAQAEKELDPKQFALDSKKKNSHTAFTVNPTKKNPFKKK